MSGVKRAFTLVEIIVTILILSLASTITLVSFARSLSNQELGSTTKELMRLARESHALAMSTGSPVELWLNPLTGEYLIGVHNESDLDSLQAGRVGLTSGASLGAKVNRVRWYWRADGSALGDGLTIRESGRTVRLDLEPVTGEMHLTSP